MKMKITKSEISLSIYTILIVAVVILGIVPGISKLSSDKKELSEGTATLSAHQEKIADLNKYNKNKAEIDTIEKVVNGLLPKEKSSSDFVVQMENLGNELAIKIPNFTITEPVAQPQPKAVTEDDASASKKTSSADAVPTPTTTQKNTDIVFNMSFKTSYLTFKTLIERFESFPRFMTLSSITLSNYNASDDTLQCNLKGNIYYGK